MSQTGLPETTTADGAEHPIGRVRSLMELTGATLIVGAVCIQVGYAVSANDDDFVESAGDFFSSVGFAQVLLALFVILGVLVAVSPRLFFRWPSSLSSAGVGIIVGLAVVLSFASVVFAAGATITAVARGSDDEFDVGAGDWVLAVGITVACIASLGISIVGVVAARTPGPRARSQPMMLDTGADGLALVARPGRVAMTTAASPVPDELMARRELADRGEWNAQRRFR